MATPKTTTQTEPPYPLEDVKNTEVKNVDLLIVSKTAHLNGTLLHGHGVLNAEKGVFEFYQQRGRYRKNPILSRTKHTTFRQHADGSIRVTINYEPKEKNIKLELITELRENFDKLQSKIAK